MRFTKMHGLGNDFLLVYGQVPENAESLCAALCDRRFGVGADGVIFLCASSVADCEMRIFNADGSEANMCGNGIRCAGKFLYENDFVRKEQMTIETRSGVKKLTLRIESGTVQSVTVDMGRAIISQKGVTLPDGMGVGTAVSVGNPHLVLFTEDADAVPVSVFGPRIEWDERFPGGVNVEFVQILSPQKLRMRVWERGCGITMACGTGACASVFAAVKQGLCPVGEPIEVKLDGGSLFITADKTDNITMEGPAVAVFSGEVAL
ncbi:MAG: diaminopimelate epimerase [Clostridia bacterium]|nr:diaminopimelate epimerase [Clostridia bacterium]